MASKIIRDFPDDGAAQLARLKRMSEEGAVWRDSWGRLWDRNVSTVRGDLWPDQASKPLFLSNIISPAIRRKAGLLVEAKPGIDIKPRKDGLQVTADVLRKTSVAIWDEQNVSMVLESLAYHLAQFGCGYIKASYDPTAQYGVGDIVIGDVDPRLMIIDPAIRRATDLWLASYLREESVVSLSWVKKHWPRTSAEVDGNAGLTYTPGNDDHKIGWYARMRDRLKRMSSSSQSAIDRVYLQQFWVADATCHEDGTPVYPGGRRIWVANESVILNPNSDPEDEVYGQANPYWDGLYPYIMLDNEPDADHPFGHAEVEALRKINEAFNAVGHMTTRTLIKNVPWIIADAGAIDAASLQDIKELEEVVVEKAPGRSVERAAPTQPTGTNIQFMQMMITLVEMYAGLNDGALQGKGRVELRSAPQLEGLQQAAQVLIRAQARRLENALERLGQLLISRIFQFYPNNRLMVYNDNGAMKQFDFQKQQLRDQIVELAKEAAQDRAIAETQKGLDAGKSFAAAATKAELSADEILEAVHGAWKLFRFKISPFSTLASTKIQRAAALQELAQQGLIPSSMIVREAGFDNAKELGAEALQEIKERQQAGFPPPDPKKQGGKKK